MLLAVLLTFAAASIHSTCKITQAVQEHFLNQCFFIPQKISWYI